MATAAETRRMNYHYMADAMRRLEWDLHQKLFTDLRIPEDWHEIARERGEPKKTQITLRVDEDVVRFFRSMGGNYQTRMNRVLASFMHARLAGILKGAETMDYIAARVPEGHDSARPRFGDLQRMEDEVMGDDAFHEGERGVPMGEERVSSEARRAELLARLEELRGS